MGQGRLELGVRAVESGRRRVRRQRATLRPTQGARAASHVSRRYDVRRADRVPAHAARGPRVGQAAEAAPLRRCRRAARSRNARALEGGHRNHDSRWLWTNGDLAARGELGLHRGEARLDGQAGARLRRPDHRPRRQRVTAQSRGGHRRARRAGASARVVRWLLEGRRGDGSRLQGRLVPHGRPRVPRRRRLLLVRRPCRRCHHHLRLPGRAVRGRERAAAARSGRRGGGGFEPRRGTRRGREGVRRLEAGSFTERSARRRPSGPRQGHHRSVQVSPPDRVHR